MMAHGVPGRCARPVAHHAVELLQRLAVRRVMSAPVRNENLEIAIWEKLNLTPLSYIIPCHPLSLTPNPPLLHVNA